jgi:hypothetical protein
MFNKSPIRWFIALIFLTPPAVSEADGQSVARQTEMEHLMPLYEIWVLDRLCSNPRYQSEIGQSRMSCIRESRAGLPRCNAKYRTKIPRNDSQEINGRLRYRDFVAGFTSCLKERSGHRHITGVDGQ